MKTLFPKEVNWGIYFFLIVIIKVAFPSLSLISFLALIIALHQFTLLFTGIGHLIPTRYLFGAFMSLQFLIGPTLAFNGLDQYQYHLYTMQIPEAEYFAYAIPAVIAFILGLHITAGDYKGEIIDQEGITFFVKKNPKIPYIFIILGFCTSVLSSFFSAEIGFVFYILGNFKFIGLFMIIFGSENLKIGPLILVIGSIIISSLGDGMFHDLLIWIIFVGSAYSIKYKFETNVKLIACISFILLAVVIQQLKGSYRAATGAEGKDAGLETLSNSYQSQNEGDNSIFSFTSLAPALVRINQGFIITHIMKTVPNRVPFSNGAEMYQILEAAILPRILAPNKLQAGDRTIFEKYSGIHLRAGTSMGLGSLGDAYLNFGIFGGCFFMFLLGLTYSTLINYFYKRSNKQPVLLLFLPLIFYYPIRPDCELQTILGHFVKSTIIILAIVYFWKGVFVDQKPEYEYEYQSDTEAQNNLVEA